MGQVLRGSPPKRRTVLTVPEMDWIVPVLEQLARARSGRRSAPGRTPRCGSPSAAQPCLLRRVDEAFSAAREPAGLPPELDLHCLRHSLRHAPVEFDYPERFVSRAGRPRLRATTAIYTGVSDDYRNRLLERSLRDRHGGLWEDPQ